MKCDRDIRKGLLAVSLAVAPLAASHAGSDLDLFYVGYTELEAKGLAPELTFDDGDGYGAKARFKINDMFFLSGEYQNVEYDEILVPNGGIIIDEDVGIEAELETWRAGLGYRFTESPFYVLGEYIGNEVEFSTTGSEDDEDTLGDAQDDSGFGVHLGAKGMATEVLSLNAQIGYVDISDSQGIEFLVGAGLNFANNFGLFADWRYTSLDGGDGDYDYDLNNARVGLRLMF